MEEHFKYKHSFGHGRFTAQGKTLTHTVIGTSENKSVICNSYLWFSDTSYELVMHIQKYFFLLLEFLNKLFATSCSFTDLSSDKLT